jgi:hypothetical protein
MSRNFELLSQLEAELLLESTVTSNVPAAARPANRVGHNGISQEFVTLAQTIFRSGDANAPHEVVLCGVDDDSRSSGICINLGRALATYSERPVCLIDANPRSARLEKLLNAGRLIPHPDPEKDLCRYIEPNLWLADLDAPDSQKGAGLASTQQVKKRLATLRTRFDFILMDAPGANIQGDASVLGQVSDGTILVIEANSTRKAAALKAKQSLQAANVRILGSVLNNRTFPIPERLYRKL